MLTRICEICNATFESHKLKKTCSKACSYKLRIITRNTQHESIEKLCASCGHTFLDSSKKKLVKNCKTCVYASMVQKRKSNGSYALTEEQKENRKKIAKHLHEIGALKLSAEGRQKLSEGFRERWKDPDFREKMRQGYVRSCGETHWTKTDDAKKRLSEKSRKYRTTEETRAKLRISASRRIREGRHKHAFLGKGGVREDLGFYVRSKWEANFARYLRHIGQSFEYESTSFTLKDGKTYTPDFKVGETFYEIKGWWSPSALEKYELFKEQYTNVDLQIIDPAVYSSLTLRYSSQILNWEH